LNFDRFVIGIANELKNKGQEEKMQNSKWDIETANKAVAKCEKSGRL
jgi:hypothetical protein